MLDKVKAYLPNFLVGWLRGMKAQSDLRKWEKAGKPSPPPHIVKHQRIREFAKRYNLNVFIETGTHKGATLEAHLKHFRQLYSIELDEKLHERAVNKFRKKTHVKIIQGDSGVKLQEIVPNLQENALFWLDAHYSGGITAMGDKECPIYEELEIIFKDQKTHIILIDDARLFVGKNDYPTIENLKKYIAGKRPEYQVKVENDIIFVYN